MHEPEVTDGIEPRSPAANLPGHRWVAEEAQVIVDAAGSRAPRGLARAGNGDLLMVAAGRSLDSGVAPDHRRAWFVPTDAEVLRSTDRGHSWVAVGELPRSPTAFGSGWYHGLQRLASGRLVMLYSVTRQEITPSEPLGPKDSRGRPMLGWSFTRLESIARGVYSDDEGRSWHESPDVDMAPFRSLQPWGCGPLFETGDGTVVASFRGHLSQAEFDTSVTSNGLIRSHDGGASWGDASVLHRAEPGSYVWFNENAILPLADGRWLAVIRCNYTNEPGQWVRDIFTKHSADRGRSWSAPVKTGFYGGEFLLLALPDGGVLMVWAHTNPDFHLDEGEPLGVYYALSYDGGDSWTRRQVLYRRHKDRPFEHVGTPAGVVLDDNSVIVVYHCGQAEHGTRGRTRVGATWLRKRPVGDER